MPHENTFSDKKHVPKYTNKLDQNFYVLSPHFLLSILYNYAMEGSFWLCIYHLCASSRYHPFGRWFVPQMHCETMEILCLQTIIFFSFSFPDSLFLPSPVIKLLNSSRNFSMSRTRFFFF